MPITASTLIVQKWRYKCIFSCACTLLCNLVLRVHSALEYGPALCFWRRRYIPCFLDVHCQCIETCWSGHPTCFQMLAKDILLTRENFHLRRKFSFSYCNCEVCRCMQVGQRKLCEPGYWVDRQNRQVHGSYITAIMT